MSDGEAIQPVRFITEAGYKLQLSEEAVSTAASFYHTFCSVMSLKDYNLPLLLMAALSLAVKAQEQSTKLGDIVNTCHRCLHKKDPPLEVGDFYWQLKDSVAKYELLLLRSLKFNVHIQLPHPYLLHFLLALSQWVDKKLWDKSCVPSISWSLLQDSFHSDLCLHYSPVTIATGVLYLALHICELDVPGNTEAYVTPWWTVFSPTANEKEVQQIAEAVMKVYDNHKSTQS